MSGGGDRGGDAGKPPARASVPADPDESGDWDAVRDSWVGEEPAPHGPPPHPTGVLRGPISSIPPPLPPTRVIDLMFERLAASDWEGTLLAADSVLQGHPRHDDARQCLEMASGELERIYRARLGIADGGDRVPHRRTDRIPRADVRARLVLREVDGKASIADIVAQSHLDPLDTLRTLSELLLQDAISFE